MPRRAILEPGLMSTEQLYRALRRRLLLIEPGAAMNVEFREKRMLWREAYQILNELRNRGAGLQQQLWKGE